MTNVEKFMKYCDGCEQESMDVYVEDNFTVTKLWLVSDGKRVSNTTVFTIYENGDGDYPLVKTLKEAKKMIQNERVARGDLIMCRGCVVHYNKENGDDVAMAVEALMAKLNSARQTPN